MWGENIASDLVQYLVFVDWLLHEKDLLCDTNPWLLQLPQCVHGMKFDHISAIYHLLEEQVAEATLASSSPSIPLYPQTLPVMPSHSRKSSITTGKQWRFFNWKDSLQFTLWWSTVSYNLGEYSIFLLVPTLLA